MRNIERIVEKNEISKEDNCGGFRPWHTYDRLRKAGDRRPDRYHSGNSRIFGNIGRRDPGVENEADLAIYKFNSTLPDGYETKIDNSEGKMYASPNGSIIVKAQNYKEEFQELSVFADQGCASIKLNNMMYQADTNFSDPQNTTVAGFDAIRYDYTVTAYIYEYETDSAGAQVTGDDGNPIITDQKDVLGEYVNRVYYFYSDEDVFYVICESRKENSEAAAKEFDEFISGVTITKK